MLRDLMTIPLNLYHHLRLKIIDEGDIFFLFFNPAAVVRILAQVKRRFAVDRHAGDKALQTSGCPERSVTQVILILNGNSDHLVALIFNYSDTFTKAFDGIPINLSVGINCAIHRF